MKINKLNLIKKTSTVLMVMILSLGFVFGTNIVNAEGDADPETTVSDVIPVTDEQKMENIDKQPTEGLSTGETTEEKAPTEETAGEQDADKDLPVEEPVLRIDNGENNIVRKSAPEKIKVVYHTNHYMFPETDNHYVFEGEAEGIDFGKTVKPAITKELVFGSEKNNEGRLAGIDYKDYNYHSWLVQTSPGGLRWIVWNTKPSTFEFIDDALGGYIKISDDMTGTLYNGGRFLTYDEVKDNLNDKNELHLYAINGDLKMAEKAEAAMKNVKPEIYLMDSNDHKTIDKAYLHKEDSPDGIRFKSKLDFSSVKDPLYLLWGRIDKLGNSSGSITARFDNKLEFEDGKAAVVFKSTWIVPADTLPVGFEYTATPGATEHKVLVPYDKFVVKTDPETGEKYKEAVLPVKMKTRKEISELTFDDFMKDMELTISDNDKGILTNVPKENYKEIAISDNPYIKVGGEIALNITFYDTPVGVKSQADPQYAHLVSEVILSFDTDGATSETPEPQNIKLTKDGKLGEKPKDAPVKERHLFDYWEINDAGAGQTPVYRMFNWENDRITKDTELKAKYSQAGYVIPKFQDEDGNILVKISDNDKIFDRVGADYNMAPKEINGYELVALKLPTNKEGKVIDGDIEVVFVYKKLPVSPSYPSTPAWPVWPAASASSFYPIAYPTDFIERAKSNQENLADLRQPSTSSVMFEANHTTQSGSSLKTLSIVVSVLAGAQLFVVKKENLEKK